LKKWSIFWMPCSSRQQLRGLLTVEVGTWGFLEAAFPTHIQTLYPCYGIATGLKIETLAARVLVDRSWNREIWIVAGNLLSRDAVEKAIRRTDSNRTKQFLMYLESLITGCGRLNSMLKIYCS